MTTRPLGLGLLTIIAASACNTLHSPVATHSASIALNPAGTQLYVVNPDADSLSIIDTTTRQLQHELLLAPARPATDGAGRYTPSVYPRAVALSPHANRLYVSGERATQLLVIDLAKNAVVNRIDVGAEPAGVLVSPDEASVYVACSNEPEVVRIDTATGKVVATVATAPKPWALAWSADSSTVYVTHLLGSDSPSTPGPGISVLDAQTLKIKTTWNIADVAPRGDDRLAYGQARGLYDIAARPGTKEVWIGHLMLANRTPQFALDFETTVFPTLTIFDSTGTFSANLTTDAEDVPGINGAFGDVVSGPHSFEFTHDGATALVLDSNSEDILAVDAANRVEATLLRPLPGHLPEGIVLSSDDKFAYVDERNTADVAIVDVDTSASPIGLTVEAKVIPRFESGDPMPAAMRLGQHLFFSANSDELPITTNHWVACGTCHVEGRSDSVTWQFIPGPRDTPSNAGGTLDTGFLLHTADRRVVQDYWRVIDIEQGGSFTPSVPVQQDQLNALEAFVDYALPIPIPPHTDPAMVARGQMLFESTTVGCAACHYGAAHTDSGAGNPTLDLSGPIVTTLTTGGILLHDVGTCNTGSAYPDLAHTDDVSNPRQPCLFDTPALRGLADSAPYFHDGSAQTLMDVLTLSRGQNCNGRPGCAPMGNIEGLSQDDLNSLVEYLRSL